MSLTNKQLDHWIKHNMNVLVEGPRGCGKSSIVMEAFQRNKIVYLYFSAATMDPWVDFIGVPKEVEDPATKHVYLDLIRPRIWTEEAGVEALILDEFNRAPKKVRNAAMELIQFKSINGKVFPKLRMVWVMCNPETSDEGSYDVEPLDPAQRDRFQIQVSMPSKPDLTWFQKRFGKEVGSESCTWWNALNNTQQNLVSPRRLEYAVDWIIKSGKADEVLAKDCNPKSLETLVTNLSYTSRFMNAATLEDKKKVLDEPNAIRYIVPQAEKDPDTVGRALLMVVTGEKLEALLQGSRKMQMTAEAMKSHPDFKTQYESTTFAKKANEPKVNSSTAQIVLKFDTTKYAFCPMNEISKSWQLEDSMQKLVIDSSTDIAKLSPMVDHAHKGMLTQPSDIEGNTVDDFDGFFREVIEMLKKVQPAQKKSFFEDAAMSEYSTILTMRIEKFGVNLTPHLIEFIRSGLRYTPAEKFCFRKV